MQKPGCCCPWLQPVVEGGALQVDKIPFGNETGWRAIPRETNIKQHEMNDRMLEIKKIYWAFYRQPAPVTAPRMRTTIMRLSEVVPRHQPGAATLHYAEVQRARLKEMLELGHLEYALLDKNSSCTSCEQQLFRCRSWEKGSSNLQRFFELYMRDSR
jgi:hypothetical protein